MVNRPCHAYCSLLLPLRDRWGAPLVDAAEGGGAWAPRGPHVAPYGSGKPPDTPRTTRLDELVRSKQRRARVDIKKIVIDSLFPKPSRLAIGRRVGSHSSPTGNTHEHHPLLPTRPGGQIGLSGGQTGLSGDQRPLWRPDRPLWRPDKPLWRPAKPLWRPARQGVRAAGAGRRAPGGRREVRESSAASAVQRVQ